MTISRGFSTITKNDVLSKVTEEYILNKYFNITKVPCLVHSPLRQDTKPSFAFYTKDGVSFFYRDFATGEGGSIFKLLGLLWNIDIQEVYNKLYNDLGNSIKVKKGSRKSNIISVRTNSKLEVKVRKWRDYDIEYWNSYGIALKWLKLADIYPISHKIVTIDNKKYTFGVDKYAYAYVERKEGNITIKIYQPFNKDGFKWATSTDRSVISLWTKIPQQGDKLCICSSMKDALCLWANMNIPCIALQGEGYPISDTAIKVLKERYKSIYILLDNDTPGLEDAQKLSQMTGFTNITLPQFEGGKDISDMYKILGIEKFKEILISLFN